MGSSLSNLTENGSGNGVLGLGDIPESCVACVFLYLTPPEICNLARLNRAFRGAASSDAVWESKLPSNYHDLLHLLSNPQVYQTLCKKDIFALLFRPLPFDDGHKVAWLDRVTGRVGLSISAKAMAITGIEDRRYWSWVPTEESREFCLHCHHHSCLVSFRCSLYLSEAWGMKNVIIILREMSPWVRTYDYTVRLLLRSLFTVVERIKYVYGINQIGFVEGIKDDEQIHGNYLIDNNSALIQPSVNPSKNSLSRFQIHMGRSFSNLGLKKKTFLGGFHSSILCGKQHEMKSKRFAPVGFDGCVGGGCESPVVENYLPSRGSSFRSFDSSQKDTDEKKGTSALPTLYDILNPKKVPFFISKRRLLNAPPSTLGHSALALHYAKVIILIEKLASSPHLISLDARDELYNMLPVNIRSCLKARLKTFSITFTLCKYDANDAAQWTLTLETILEWLSPLAHNMVKWQSERNFEGQRPFFGSNVLLVQTLYFANRVQIEAAIVELLIGLNYLSRYGSMAYGNCLYPRDTIYYNVVDQSSLEFTKVDNGS